MARGKSDNTLVVILAITAPFVALALAAGGYFYMTSMLGTAEAEEDGKTERATVWSGLLGQALEAGISAAKGAA